jgi:hypothetical protein
MAQLSECDAVGQLPGKEANDEPIPKTARVSLREHGLSKYGPVLARASVAVSFGSFSLPRLAG